MSMKLVLNKLTSMVLVICMLLSLAAPAVGEEPLTQPVEETVYSDGTIVYEDGTILYTDGTLVYADGTTVHADGTTVNTDGTTVYPDGTTVYPDGKMVYADGTTVYPDGTTVYADGTVVYSDGTIVYADGTTVHADGTTVNADGTTVYPDGTTVYADGTMVYVNGTVAYPDGTVVYPDGTTLNVDGTTVYSDGTTVYADGTTVYADGTTVYTDGTTVYPERTTVYSDGTTVYPDGTTVYPDGTTNSVLEEEQVPLAAPELYAADPVIETEGDNSEENTAVVTENPVTTGQKTVDPLTTTDPASETQPVTDGEAAGGEAKTPPVIPGKEAELAEEAENAEKSENTESQESTVPAEPVESEPEEEPEENIEGQTDGNPEETAEDPAEDTENTTEENPEKTAEETTEDATEDATEDTAEDTAEDEPEETAAPVEELPLRTLTASADQMAFRDQFLNPREPVLWSGSVWNWLYGSAIEPAYTDDRVTVEISGHLPETVTARAMFIEFADPSAARNDERALMLLDVTLLDEGGAVYVPTEKLHVSVSAGSISGAAESGEPFAAYFDDSYDGVGAAGDIKVRLDENIDGSRLAYVPEQNEALRFWEAGGRLVSTGNGTVEFEENRFPFRFVLSAQQEAREEEQAETEQENVVKDVMLSGTLVASDGYTYEVSVSYPANCGIPVGAQLSVEELILGSDAYWDYINQSAAELGVSPADLSLARAFDISFVDPATGVRYQPTQDVQVSILLLSTPVNTEEEISVLHFSDEAGGVQAMDVALNGEAIEFETGGFSVFVVLQKDSEKDLTAADGTGEANPDEPEDADDILAAAAKTVTITAGSAEKVYDGTELTINSYTNTALAAGDSIVSVTVTGGQIAAGTSDNVPSAAVIVNADGEDVTDSYDITYANGTLGVTPKALTVTTESAEKVYGDADPEFTAKIEGLVKGESEDLISYTITREEGETVGEYIITASGEAEQGNYTVDYSNDSNGIFTITKRPLTITAASETKVYDGYVLSNDGYSAEGLAEGDTVQSLTVEGTQINAGEKQNLIRDAVVVNGKGTDVTDCYNISYISGTLEVTKKPITITADSDEMVYDGTALTNEGYTSTGLADGDVFVGMTVTGSQTLVGESDNIPSDAKIVRPTEGDTVVDVNDNYDITYANGTLKVTKCELTITADSAEKVYDGAALTKETYAVKGLAEGDTVQSVTVTGSQVGAGKSDNVPTDATVVNSDGDNVTDCYNIAYENGTLEVTKKSVKLTAKSGVEVSDGAEKTIQGFTVSADGRTLDGIAFDDTVSASGSGMAVGSYPVSFTGVTLNETTDTTGNYVVTETEDGTLLITGRAPLEKSLSFSGNEAEYTITVNPDELELNGGNNLTLQDTFTNNQSIEYSSVSVSTAVPYDFSGHTGTFTIPDETPVTITYKTRVAGAAGTTATFGNTAELGVTQNGSFASWFRKTLTETQTITPSGSDIEGTGGVYTIKLFTYAQDHMEKGLGGAVFRLLDANQRPIAYQAGEQAGNPVTFVTGDNGYVDIALDDGIVSIRKNTVYYLEMITAPVAQNTDGSFTYYQKDNTLYRFLITDDPSYTGEYNYFNGDVLKVRCYPESAGVNVTKRFSGNFSLTDEQKNQIRFVLQKEDLSSGNWVDVEAHTYAEFSYGSMNFNAGRAGGPPLEQAVLYRLIEENDAVEGVDHSSSVTLAYQRDNQTVQENTNEFEVNPDHSTFSFSLVFDNAYVDHKLTLVKMNELSGVLLPGAEFTVFEAAENTQVKTYTTDQNGTLTIHRGDEGANYAPDTAYYVVETTPPATYIEPKNPERIYFYFSENSTGVPDGIPDGTTAVDLTTSYDTVTIDNQTETVKVPVTVTWDVDGVKSWPDGVVSVITLYQSVSGEDPVPVKRDSAPMTVTLSSTKTFDNTTFVDLPVRDDSDNDITYSVVQEALPGYYTSCKVSGTGWHVVRNESAVSVTVIKQWYGLDGSPLSDAGDKQDVAFDLYRTTGDHPGVTTREDLENILRGEEPVLTGLVLSADNSWTNTVNSLQKQDANGALYYYFALEREDSMPRNNEDSYVVSPADEGSLRTLNIRNTQTPITVVIQANDLSKAYGQDDPGFTFTSEVQDDDCTISTPVKNADGTYTVTVTKGTETKQITFTCSREAGEDVGSYAIKLTGETSQEGYRVRLDNSTLTITRAQVTVKGTASKIYGDPDPSLVEITGLKEGDTIAYYAYRDIGEQKGSYRITVTGLTKQGNYEITYINDYLTIEPAPVTVTADYLSKDYGQDDPTLTVTIDGLKNQDAASVIHYDISREDGETVGDYPVTVTGDEVQGNYTVTFESGIFTINGQKVTVRAKNLRKTYGDPDPSSFEVEITGLSEGEKVVYTVARVQGEDVGTYVITPSGDTAQDNYEVTFEPGLLTIERADLTVTPVNVIKALTEPTTPDPQLTVTFDELVNHDDEIVPTAVYEAGTWTYTYTREGETEPEFAFTLSRTPGEKAGPYIIAASAFGERPKNYNITYKTGIFTILATYNVVVNQQTRDLVDYAQNPEYTYTAELDLRSIDIDSYNGGDFVDNHMSFTLPADGSSSKTLAIPSGAKLTVTQDTENPDYTTDITLDNNPVTGTTIEINPVNKAASIVVTHTRITLPVQARAALRQTIEGKADETDAVPVTPLAYLGIPRDAEQNPIRQSAEDVITDLDTRGVFNLPEDMYYVPEHASVYNGDAPVAPDIQAIFYDAESKAWQYSLDGSDFIPFTGGQQLEVFYMPNYICRVQADGEAYYTLNEALNHIRDAYSGTGVIEMLIGRYTMPSADALVIPADCNITLTTAAELETTATILRKPSFNTGHMFNNKGTLTLESITIDGNGDRVAAGEAMVLNNGTLTVRGGATLQNASGNNGGAIYAASGSVVVEAGATFTGNNAVNGGAIYFYGGSLSIAIGNITGNSATYGGAVYVSDASGAHTLTITGTLSGNSASNGGAVYMAGGTVNLSGGSISGNSAASGGAVFMSGGTLNLTGGTVGGNKATDGGAFYLAGGTLNMSGGTVSGNSATQDGGAFYSGNATVSITGGSITGNDATNGSGGAVLLASGNAAIGSATVRSNSADNGFGGAVYQTGGILTVTGTMDGENTAQNGSAVYVQTGTATFDGANITGNIATEGGAIGVGSEEARLFFSGDVKVTGNTWNEGKGNLYLDRDTDLVINTAGLGGNADIGVHVAEDYLSTRGDAGCKFGTYTASSNLSKFKNDVYPGLTACDNNYKIIWSKSINVAVVRLNSYGSAFPPENSLSPLVTFSYYPKSQTNNIYDLVMEMYNSVYKAKITGDDLYAYSFATTATDFAQFLSAVNWNSGKQCWNFVERSGDSATGDPSLRIYYSQGAYISVVNNSAYDLTVDSMTVLGKAVPFYGYPTVKNNITLDTLTPVTAEDLVLKSGENVKLLFPGAVGRNWTLTGTFTDPATHKPVSNAAYKYTLDRTHGGTEQDGTADAEGKITHNGTTNGTPGGSYEILFGDPTYICKVTDGNGEHPFPTLNAAWNYIVVNDLTYGGTPGGKIEMLVDYLQPLSDVLTINEASFTSRGKNYNGYRLELTTAATSGVQYPYVGEPEVTRATISRDSDNGGAAVIAMPYKRTKAATEEECDAFLMVDNLTFDGKALAKKGNGGAISTANNVVTITNCDFMGYQASRGGAIFVAWGKLNVDYCTFSNCSTGDNTAGVDKVGGGGIWTTAQHLTVTNTDFDNCSCILGNSQGGGIFHNIRDNNLAIYNGGDNNEYAAFPVNYYQGTETIIENCTFQDCYSAQGSGGTVESDSMQTTVTSCTFKGSYSNKNNANGGALNILHNGLDANVYENTSLIVTDTTFEDCKTQTGASNGGAICDQNSEKVTINGCSFINCDSNDGGAVRAKKTATVEIHNSLFMGCTARNSGGAVNAAAVTMTISDTKFQNCSAPSYGGVYQTGNATGSTVTVNNAWFDNCKSVTNNAGALMVNAKTLSITGTARMNEDSPYTFRNCSAGKSGGAVYHCTNGNLQATLTDVSFYNCKAGAEGGAARLTGAEIYIVGAEVQDCEAVTNGGGLYLSAASALTDCVFSGNKATGATGNGGSLYINSGNASITGGSIRDSVAVLGGGIYNKGTLTITKESDDDDAISNCVARTSGGGIYNTTGAVTLDGAVISDCHAVTSGGGIYQNSGTLNLYGTIRDCCAEQGGGVYSRSAIEVSDATKSMLISDCHAATVTITESGTATVEKKYLPENLGGGVYKSAGNWNLKSAEATISGCTAYEGAGVYYNSTGTLTYSAGNFYGNTASNNGGAIYKNAGTISMTGGVIGGSDNNANRAQLGAGIFVADGQKITLGGGKITHNVAEVGGAVAVGGNNANTQLLFQGAPVIKNNTNSSGEKCNVYLNYDTNGIIRTPGTALSAGAYIGVYVIDEQFTRHGDYTMPFGTYNKTDNLSSFFNDRIYAGGKKGSSNQIVWGEFVCKITDGDGNLLYTDATCETPAVYMTLENDGAANTSSAYGTLQVKAPRLYNANGLYEGAYQIQMLVPQYTTEKRMGSPTDIQSKVITLTTADPDADDGFPFTGDRENPHTTITRGGTFKNSWITVRDDLTITNITLDGNSVTATEMGGTIAVKNGGIARLGENAQIINSFSSNHGGAVALYNSGTNRFYLAGGSITNCGCAGKNGGAVYFQNNTGQFYMSDGQITGCSAAYGGAVYASGKVYMSGGEITGNTATAEAGGIDLTANGVIHFSGNPVVNGNTLNGNACNVHLTNDNNTSIYADGLGPFAEIRVYTTNGTVRTNHGVKGKPFGTWTEDSNLHGFINDVTPRLHGMKAESNNFIYWEENAILTVGKTVDSDWSADKDVEFEFTVIINGQDDFSGVYEDMTFNRGTATFTLKAGQAKTASGLPFDFINNEVSYTVTESLPEGQTAYTTQYKHNDGKAADGTYVTGVFGENLSEDPLLSSNVSRVEFVNTRVTDELTVSKTVTEGTGSDFVTPFDFTITLDDNTITRTYNTKLFQDQNDADGTDGTISFTNGFATFQLIHGQSIEILGLPKELGFKVEENRTEEQLANFRVYVKNNDGDEAISYSSAGTVGELKHVTFRNNRYGLVCKIVNDTAGREQLYYRDHNDPNADPTPAIFDELEKAFKTISDGINLFTVDGASADVKLRVEMVQPNYAMTRQAILAAGYNVTLGTAKKTDRLYPYPTDADAPAVVTRGYVGGSMIVDRGNLTIDDIILDGADETYSSNEDGGIVQVNDDLTLTVTNKATLRNSVSTGNGGAVYLPAGASLLMNGTIANCRAINGGGIYAKDGFSDLTITGTVAHCEAVAGNGGAIYAGTATGMFGVAPVVLTDSASLSGNTASNNGGAVYSAADVEINSTSVAIVAIYDNTAEKDGGGIYLTPDAAFTMNGGTISGNVATTGNGGGLVAQDAVITNAVFTDNTAPDGNGGAIYAKENANVTITGETTFTGNNAARGGAVYDQGSVVMSAGSMSGNSATEKGGAVYVHDGHSFTMSGGSISGNSSPEGAISTGEDAELNFSGNAEVFSNTASYGSTAMNVFLGFHSNTIIRTTGLTDTGKIGVYVTDGEGKLIYYNHGIANRPFGTGSGENLSRFINDRDESLTGVQGKDGLIMWPGKDLLIQVYQNKADGQGQKTTPVGGAKFSLTNESGVTIWSGESNPVTSLNPGLLRIPWGITESENGGTAASVKETEGTVSAVSYVLTELEANQDTVRPAGTWELTIGPDNAVTWKAIPPVTDEGQETPDEDEASKVNRILNVESVSGAHLGGTFRLYDDVKPAITFDPNGGKLSGKEDTSSRTDTVNFTTTELKHTYKVEEPNPTRESYVFRAWSTVKNPLEGDGHQEYKHGDEILFYRHTDDDDLTLYALWSGVVCKITDRNDTLLYVNGSPAVYMSLKDGFDAFNDADFTDKDGKKATPRKIKMLVDTYEMTETVELARGKTAEFMTASSNDTDGYAGPDVTCVITRASSFDSGSMIIDNYNLVLRDIILDGSLKDSSGSKMTIKGLEGNENIGGIITVTGNASHLTLAQGATLRNATVNGNGGAIYASTNTVVTVSDGSITGCQAVNGGAIYADLSSTVDLSGGEISGNTAAGEGEEAQAKGGAIYAEGKVNMSGGVVKNNSSITNGGGFYLSDNATFTMTGGSLTGNSSANGGGIYSGGGVVLSNAKAAISGNTASGNGGGVYVSESGSLTMTAGSIGAESSPNTAVNGSGVYLAGEATLTGGSISYNGTEGSGNGGGIYLNTADAIILSGIELSHNQAANGGAVYAVKPEGTENNITFAKGTISDNTASGNGGGVYLASGVKFDMTGGTLGTNQAANGGGAYVGSGSDMTLSGGTIRSNTAKSGTDDTTGNGAAIYVDGNNTTSYGTLRVKAGTISGNRAGSFGGAVYLQDYGQLHVSGGTISENAAANANGGAINAADKNARIYLSGSPTIFNNPGNAATTAQKNLVLSVDQNNIINTEESGLAETPTKGPSGMVGIYVVDDYVNKHGIYNTPFGTFGSTDEKRINAKNLVNDRSLSLHGVDKGTDIIYWQDVVCKVTDANDVMLYELVNVNNSGVNVYAPAVYTSLEDGFDAVERTLYRKSGSYYAVVKTGAVKVKMLRDYTLDGNEIILYNMARDVTLTTAETNNNDGYFYTPSQEGVTRATLTRAQTSNSMFTVNTGNRFDVSNLIIDGGSNTMMTASGINGGGFNIVAVSSSAFDGVTLKNLNATGSGGAVYLNSGTMSLRNSTVIGNAAAVAGAGIYLAQGSRLEVSGNLDFGRKTDGEGNVLSESTGTGNYVSGGPQDIFIAGYPSATAESLVVAGEINCKTNGTNGTEDESIWVWAAELPHYKTLEQFARIKYGTEVSEDTLKVFRNARPDADTDNNTDGYLYGTSEGDTPGYVYWSGVKGSRRVILRKVNDGYTALSGATFDVCRGNSYTPYVIRKKNADGSISTESLDYSRLISQESGVFWIGDLPYGTYTIREINPPTGYNAQVYSITVNEYGVGYSTDGKTFQHELNPIS